MPAPQGPRSGQQRGNPAPHQAQSGGQPQDSGFARIRFGKPLDPELFNGIAKEATKLVAAVEDRNRNKSTQLRRFYDELCLWEMRVAQQPEKFAEYLPFIRMLNAKVAYAEGRKLVDQNFVRLMHHTLGEVKDTESLAACKLFWEAFMGFYKQERAD
ncbi:MAG TPA: type III-A CRISPR-associated protein Csm2 [Candidatus Competibacteraceae bacterium]|nr:type III-A CRISPR-associated protein Csm2 [Candidatus Competibacteraceae bacterium]